MVKEPVIQDGKKTTTEVEALWTIVGTIGDTTWRMFVPSVGFTLLGVWLDAQFNTKPWLMFGGIILGMFGAYLLVVRQISVIKQKKELNRD